MDKVHRLTISDDVSEYISYCSDTGLFHRTKSKHTRYLGLITPKEGKGGYHYISFRGVKYAAHRLAWFLTFGETPNYIDHINGIPSDNRLANLREATSHQNSFNRKGRGLWPKGVTWNVSCRKFQVQIKAYGKSKYVGVFSTIEEAVQAHARIARELHGDFARGSS